MWIWNIVCLNIFCSVLGFRPYLVVLSPQQRCFGLYWPQQDLLWSDWQECCLCTEGATSGSGQVIRTWGCWVQSKCLHAALSVSWNSLFCKSQCLEKTWGKRKISPPQQYLNSSNRPSNMQLKFSAPRKKFSFLPQALSHSPPPVPALHHFPSIAQHPAARSRWNSSKPYCVECETILGSQESRLATLVSSST